MPTDIGESRMYKGVALSVLASVTFGVLYFYTQLLKPLDSEETFAWRMLATLPFLTLFMWWSRFKTYFCDFSAAQTTTKIYSLADFQFFFMHYAIVVIFMGTD